MSTISTLEVANLILINDVCTFLSLFGGMVSLFLLLKTSTTFVSKMVLCLTIANLIYTISNAFAFLDNREYLYCDIKGVLMTFTTLSCFFWVTKIALTGFRAVASTYYYLNMKSDIIKGFLIPFLIALIPLVRTEYLHYSPVELSCEVSSSIRSLKVVWVVVFLLGPMLISILLTIYYYARIILLLRNQEEFLGISLARFLIYPITVAVVWLPTIIYRILYLSGVTPVWLLAVAIALSRSFGFFNMLLYGWEHYKAYKNSPKLKPKQEDSIRYRSSFGSLADYNERRSTISESGLSFYLNEPDLEL